MGAIRKIIFGCCVVALMACGPEPKDLPAAPLGAFDALQNLADAFEKHSEGMTQSPNIQVPEVKKAFVETVFQTAGYDYTATLYSFNTANFDPADQSHRDLADLMLYPLKGYAPEEAAKIYSPEDLERINQLRTWLR